MNEQEFHNWRILAVKIRKYPELRVIFIRKNPEASQKYKDEWTKMEESLIEVVASRAR